MMQWHLIDGKVFDLEKVTKIAERHDDDGSVIGYKITIAGDEKGVTVESKSIGAMKRFIAETLAPTNIAPADLD